METTDKKVEETKNQKQEEPKIVNLFEDMNPHTHNKDSYDKMIQKQNEENSK